MQQLAKSKNLQIWLVRHGQTEGNKQQIMQGQDGGQLTELGFQQGEALGQRLSKEKFDFVFVSDLNRTIQTFECIKKHHHREIIPILEPLIREKHAGVLQGQPLGAFRNKAQESKQDLRVYKPEGGESWGDVYKRVELFLAKLQALPSQQPSLKILVVTHGGYIMEFVNHLNYLQTKKPPAINNNSQNCSITVAQYKGPKDIKFLLQNDTSHIKN